MGSSESEHVQKPGFPSRGARFRRRAAEPEPDMCRQHIEGETRAAQPENVRRRQGEVSGHALSTIQTRYGIFSIDERRDGKMARALRSGTYPNEELLSIARRFMRSGGTLVDVGAHIGTFAVPASAFAATVIAFEPSPASFELLDKNSRQSGRGIDVRNRALGGKTGSGTLVSRAAANAGAHTLAPGGAIPVARLDDEVPRADVIKIDVEGMELEVLLGAQKLMQESRPVVIFEVNLSQLRSHGTSPRALADFFFSRGYRLYYPMPAETPALARVKSATLLSALIAPRAWLLQCDSAPFDLVAVPAEHPMPMPIAGFLAALRSVVGNNLAVKRRRLAALLPYTR